MSPTIRIENQTKPFQATLEMSQIDDDSQSHCDAIVAIVQEHGLAPEECVYRGVSGSENVSRLQGQGQNREPERFTGKAYAMPMSRWGDGFSFDGYTSETFDHTPLTYATGSPDDIGAVAIYDRSRMKPVPPRDEWTVQDGQTFLDVLIGIILVRNC